MIVLRLFSNLSNRRINRFLLLAGLLGGCSSGCFLSAQARYDARARERTLILMDVDAMFTDPKVRELARAVSRGNTKKIEGLIQEGVDVNAQGRLGVTPLYCAMNDLNGFRKLLELGANPDIVYGDGSTILYWVSQFKTPEYLRIALEHGADPNIRNGQDQSTPLFQAIADYEATPHDENIYLLIGAGADINARDKRGRPVIFRAIQAHRFEIAYELLMRGADYHAVDMLGYNIGDEIAFERERMNPDTEHSVIQEMYRLIAWLNERGVHIPDKWVCKPCIKGDKEAQRKYLQ